MKLAAVGYYSQIVLLCALALFRRLDAYPSRLTSDCGRALAVGDTYMGSAAYSSTSNSIKIQRGSTVLTDGDAYVPGETLAVSINSAGSNQYLLEVNGGTFTGGSCSGTRSTSGRNIVMPSTGTVGFKMGWANRKTAVQITPTLNLVPATASPSNAPVVPPTRDPTTAPTSSEPTLAPSTAPTPSPTDAPSVAPTTARPSNAPVTSTPTVFGDTIPPTEAPTERPSALPTFFPSKIPSRTPTRAPTQQPTLSPTSNPTLSPTLAPTLEVETSVTYTVDQTIADLDPSALDDADTLQEIEQSILDSLADSPSSVAITSYSRRRRRSRQLLSVSPQQQQRDKSDEERGESIAERSALLRSGQEVETTVVYTVQYVLEATGYSSVDDLTTSFDTYVTSSSYTQLLVATLQASADPSLAVVTGSTVEEVSPAEVQIINSAPPTEAPTGIDTNDDAFHAPVETKIGVGVAVGSVGLGGVIALTLWFVGTESSTERTARIKNGITNCASICACLLGVLAIILVAFWAQDGSGDQYQFLGKPNWNDNPLAYHPVLAVGLFFFAQVLMLNIGRWVTEGTPQTALRVALAFAALIGIFVSLRGVSEYIKDTKAATLTTMHSWVGIMSIVTFILSFVCNGLGLFVRASSIQRLARALSLSAFGVTTFAIVTGIVNYLPGGSCAYVLQVYPAKTEDVDPAQNYAYLPNACKIANGLAVVTCLVAILTVISVHLREEILYEAKEGSSPPNNQFKSVAAAENESTPADAK